LNNVKSWRAEWPPVVDVPQPMRRHLKYVLRERDEPGNADSRGEGPRLLDVLVPCSSRESVAGDEKESGGDNAFHERSSHRLS